MYKNLKYLFISSLFFVACSEDIKEEVIAEDPLSKGSADFTKYVALGNSLTAGFSDNALFKAGQINAYPNLMAEKFAEVGGGSFTTPFTNDNVGGLLAGGLQIQGPRLVFYNGAPVPLNIAVPGSVPTTEIGVPLTGPFNNMGVPGAKSYHLVAPNYGNIAGLVNSTANPYFVRFRSSASTTILNDALAQNPTFFSLWIGNNDVLSYATSGGTGVDQSGNPNPATYGSNDISDPAMFNSVYNQMIDALTAAGRKGVVANIPSITSAPFFTTIPYNVRSLSGPQVAALNSGYAAYNGGLQLALSNNLITQAEFNARRIEFKQTPLLPSEDRNGFVIIDSNLTNLSVLGLPSLRHAVKGEYILFSSNGVSAQAHLAAGNGTQFPLTNNWVLTRNEVSKINIATTAFNNTIKAAAESKGLAFVDINSIMTKLSSTGIRFDNYHMSAQYAQGGVFSWDGIHITARANAYIANQFLEAIERTYGAKFNKFKPQDKPITYPSFLPN
ncbi:G-D-S-L family lipolytic protein [Flavobacterium sp.]|jgi:hypothetical protein|uniref:G-D-S-L family lipolytic protein n=1 Tax=Flavobacterium sp. TaxID=239 RepID=UPI0037BF2964